MTTKVKLLHWKELDIIEFLGVPKSSVTLIDMQYFQNKLQNKPQQINTNQTLGPPVSHILKPPSGLNLYMMAANSTLSWSNTSRVFK